MNLSFQAILDQPRAGLEMLLITGTFPALAWMAYVTAGLAIGRSAIHRRSRMTLLVVLGAGLALVASAASWFLMVGLEGRDKLAVAAAQSMTLADFTNLLVWGGGGTTPATSLWWLGTIAPHTATPPDLMFTLGIAVAVIGVALILGLVAPRVLKPVAAIGSMPLSLYTAHLLLLVVPLMPEDRSLEFCVHLMLLGSFALLWRAFFTRGPLEWLLGRSARMVGQVIRGKSHRR